MADSSIAVEVDGISRSFGTTKALDNVSFEVHRGSVFGLLGPNGAGKTTLFSIIARFLNPDAGAVRVLGIDVRENLVDLLGRLSILPQDAMFDRNVPIMDQLTFFRQLEGIPRKQARGEVLEALAKVGLSDYAERGVQILSHGMSKRVGVAQAFLGNPEVVLLDEPTAGLDPHNALQVREIVRELTAKDATVVISSHNLLEIQEMCDHVTILDRGKVVRTGNVREITRASACLNFSFSRKLTVEELQWFSKQPGVSGVESKSELEVSVELSEDASKDEATTANLQRALLDQGIAPESMSRGGSLEELFLKLTAKGDE